MVIESEFEKLNLHPVQIDLGEVEIEEELDDEQLVQLGKKLEEFGFALLDDQKKQIIEKVKIALIELVDSDHQSDQKLSDYVAKALLKDYHLVSTLFSSVEGITIEKYYINLRLEKAKELLAYGEMTLSEIAYKLGFSSVSHLSGQFRKVTGMTPTEFRKMSVSHRQGLDEL